ncbi:uncharacterized protein LOC124411651 isoform X1 [Diprion similis]|uniref:uncharacterized protein LOC124411651 isoform X1 n=1 Tax=Diprion similis TaxID=362088 RepID=UPI001EF8F876|nr:uncharacterized protein LOC124411651 isoform X1 [Diprion similis]XP_046746856.1 uncharacterized protein LOC124411651 isoform X1 [Diprion similis]
MSPTKVLQHSVILDVRSLRGLFNPKSFARISANRSRRSAASFACRIPARHVAVHLLRSAKMSVIVVQRGIQFAAAICARRNNAQMGNAAGRKNRVVTKVSKIQPTSRKLERSEIRRVNDDKSLSWIGKISISDKSPFRISSGVILAARNPRKNRAASRDHPQCIRAKGNVANRHFCQASIPVLVHVLAILAVRKKRRFLLRNHTANTRKDARTSRKIQAVIAVPVGSDASSKVH